MNPDIVVVKTAPEYPNAPGSGSSDSWAEAVRSLWTSWGKDPANPFGEWVGPGGRVVIKPNWVKDHNPNGASLDSLVTHPALIEAVIDAAAVALGEAGTIVIGDSPLQSCRFDRLMAATGMDAVLDAARRRHPAIEIHVEDWRLTLYEQTEAGGRTGRAAQAFRAEHDARVDRDYRVVDLGTESFVEEIADYADQLRVTCYRPSLMRSHHVPGTHEYLVTKRIFGADLVVNLPKMKTHIKAGLTGALKNLVGINGHKEYLPHHIRGSYMRGGDCYYRANLLSSWYDAAYDDFWEANMAESGWRRRVRMLLMDTLWRASRLLGGDGISAGSWSGNETIWRTTLDLNHILYGPDGARKGITIVDGVVAGEGEGPLTPTPVPAGLLIAGENPATVDAALARLMGYNLSRVPTVYHALTHRKSRFAQVSAEEIAIAYAVAGARPERLALADLPNLDFRKPYHWQRAAVPSPQNGEMERRRDGETAGAGGAPSPSRGVAVLPFRSTRRTR